MNKEPLEKNIRDLFHTDEMPSRVSFAHMLSQLEETPVTETQEMRYTKKTTLSNIIFNHTPVFATFWKSKSIVFVSSFILLLFIGISTLAPQSSNRAEAIEKIAQETEALKEPEVDLSEDESAIINFDESSVEDLGILENEI